MVTMENYALSYNLACLCTTLHYMMVEGLSPATSPFRLLILPGSDMAAGMDIQQLHLMILKRYLPLDLWSSQLPPAITCLSLSTAMKSLEVNLNTWNSIVD
jgi:hypothetical protein